MKEVGGERGGGTGGGEGSGGEGGGGANGCCEDGDATVNVIRIRVHR